VLRARRIAGVQVVNALREVAHGRSLAAADVELVAVKDLVHPHALAADDALAHVAAAVILLLGNDGLGAEDARLQTVAKPHQLPNHREAGRDRRRLHLGAVADDAQHHVAHVERDAQRHGGQPLLRAQLVEGKHLLLDRHRRADDLAALLHDDVEAVVGEVEHGAALARHDGRGALDHLVDAVKQQARILRIGVNMLREREPDGHDRHSPRGECALVDFPDGLLAQKRQDLLRHEPAVGVLQAHAGLLLLTQRDAERVDDARHTLQLVARVQVEPSARAALRDTLHFLGKAPDVAADGNEDQQRSGDHDGKAAEHQFFQKCAVRTHGVLHADRQNRLISADIAENAVLQRARGALVMRLLRQSGAEARQRLGAPSVRAHPGVRVVACDDHAHIAEALRVRALQRLAQLGHEARLVDPLVRASRAQHGLHDLAVLPQGGVPDRGAEIEDRQQGKAQQRRHGERAAAEHGERRVAVAQSAEQ